MGKKTALFAAHENLGGKLVDFGGWDMPLHYGSQLREHQAVRQNCGMFDVSHMQVVDVAGADAQTFLRLLLANDVARITPNKALYATMLNADGGIIDDLIVYQLAENDYRLVINCGTADSDLVWIHAQTSHYEVTITRRDDLGIIAVQGPEAINKTLAVVCDNAVAAIEQMPAFGCQQVGSWTLARTGYTGEDGLEIILPVAQLTDVWQRLLTVGVTPVGLGARDTLRLEAGLNLYGNDMDTSVSPLSSNLAWTVAWQPQERKFIGRKALEIERDNGVKQQLVGVVMTQKGVLRAHQKVMITGLAEQGEMTSGTFSPTLGYAIGLARVPAGAMGEATVLIRGKQQAVSLVKPCFVRKGQHKIQNLVQSTST